MVKNAGGNKSKKMGRKFLTAPVDKKIRLSQEEAEIYAVVTKNLGNGMFYANDPDGRELLCIMRRKFKGRGKRDNTVSPGGWVLVGQREFESCAKPKHDLLEVYSEHEKQKLKKTGDPVFSKLKSEYDKSDDMDDDFTFDNDDFNDANKYKDLLAQIEEADVGTDGAVGTGTVGAKSATIIDDDGEEVDFHDI
jgi:hypothetical protein